jgi:Fic family protein
MFENVNDKRKEMDKNLEKAVTYHYDRFPPTNINYEAIFDSHARATRALSAYEEMFKAIPDSEILLGPLITHEAVQSSKMEGTVSTIDEVLKYEADYDGNVKDTALASSDTKETALYKKALLDAQKAIEDGYPLSSSLIKAIHQTLLSEGRGATKSPGQFKVEQNFIADRKEILFVPISPEKLQDGLDLLFDYIEQSAHNELIKIGVTHVEFEALHPFKDGNGRIGRMLVTLMLWQLKQISKPHFYISDYLEEHRDVYLDTMRNVSAHDDWNNWLIFFFNAIENQAKKNHAVAGKIRQLYEDLDRNFHLVLKSAQAKDALDFMFKHPKFRNNKFIKESGIPESTAARFTRELVKANYLATEEKASGRKPALYSLAPLMEIVRKL